MTPFTPPAAPAGPSTAKVLVAVGVSMALIVILGVVAALVLGTASRERFEAVGTASPWVGGPQPWSFPAAQDEGPTLGDTWQAAYGVYVCDEFIAPFDGPSPMGFGIDTAGDGIIDIEPVNDTVTLYDATMKVFGDQVGMRWRPGGLELPDGTVVTDCDGRPVDVVVFRWQQARPDQLTPEVEYGPLSNVMFRRDGEVFTIAVVPAGTAEDLAWERRDRLMPPSVDVLKAGTARRPSGSRAPTSPETRRPLEAIQEVAESESIELEQITLGPSTEIRAVTNLVVPEEGYRDSLTATHPEQAWAHGTVVPSLRIALWVVEPDAGSELAEAIRQRPTVDLGIPELEVEDLWAIHWNRGGTDRTTIVMAGHGHEHWGAFVLDGHLTAEDLVELIAPLTFVVAALEDY